MRIALFHNLPSGGAKRAVYEWTRRLSERHEIHAYTLSTADAEFCDIRPWVERHVEVPFVPSRLLSSPLGRVNQWQRWRDLGRLTAIGRGMAGSIDEAGYDVVFAHTCRFTFIPTLLFSLRCPAVYYLHEPFGRALPAMPVRAVDPSRLRTLVDRVDPLIRLYRSRLGRLQARGASLPIRFLANSAYTASRMREAYGLRAEVCAPGVDLDLFCAQQPPAKGAHILAVGELSPRKGFDFLVEAVALMPSSCRPALRLVCNSVIADERRYVERLARGRGVTLEIKVGLTSRQLAREYNEARLCAVASVHEPFGLVALEAMSCETPVVGVREGGVPETVVHERTGLLVERRLDSFAGALQRLLSEPGLLAACGKNGRAHVAAGWGWERSVAGLERHFQGAATAGAS